MEFDGKTQSKEEAIALLKRHRADLIQTARRIAVAICRGEHTFSAPHAAAAARLMPGRVCSRILSEELKAAGRLANYNGGMTWLGAVFSGSQFAETADPPLVYADEARNTHQKRSPWWRLASTAPAEDECRQLFQGGQTLASAAPPRPALAFDAARAAAELRRLFQISRMLGEVESAELRAVALWLEGGAT
jgi:hypothetical protein